MARKVQPLALTSQPAIPLPGQTDGVDGNQKRPAKHPRPRHGGEPLCGDGESVDVLREATRARSANAKQKKLLTRAPLPGASLTDTLRCNRGGGIDIGRTHWPFFGTLTANLIF
jgi:hypothetical protein